jgi:multidrug resistance efflux pump
MNPRFVILPMLLAGLIVWGFLHRDRIAPRLSGTIEADDARLASRQGGRVIRLAATEGVWLTNGQVVVELEAPELQARIDEAAARLAELEAGPRQEQIVASRQQWEAILADLALARLEAARKEELYAARAASDTERDTTRARAQMLENQAAAAKARYDELTAGTRQEQIAQAVAQLRALVIGRSELRVVAAAPAFLERLLVRVGDVVPPNGPVASVLYPSNLWLRVYVPEPKLAAVREGEAVTLKVDGHPGRTFEGRIDLIGRQAEFTPRNVQTIDERVKQVFGVRIRVQDPDGLLRPGMSADVALGEVATK